MQMLGIAPASLKEAALAILTDQQDAFGAALRAHLHGKPSPTLILERDDGWHRPAMAPAEFFKRPQEWLWWERELLTDLDGPVLDLGCGAGRHALELQQRGLNVVGIDNSPGAIAVCRERGLRDVRLADLTDPPAAQQQWGTILLMCGNLGLAGGWDETRALLRQLANCARTNAVLIADTVDPTTADNEEHLAYMRTMHERGLPLGLVRLRLRLAERVTPWWNLLNVPAVDLETLVAGTGWNLECHINDGVDQAIRLRRIT